jgi:hypothetical protein
MHQPMARDGGQEIDRPSWAVRLRSYTLGDDAQKAAFRKPGEELHPTCAQSQNSKNKLSLYLSLSLYCLVRFIYQ